MRIVLADDHALIRDSFKDYLAPLAPEISYADAECLQSVLAAADGPSVDLILLDLHMPGMNGAASVKQVRDTFPNSFLVVVSGQTDSTTIIGTIRAGANGYIPKASRGKAMLAALRLILDGETYVPSIMVTTENAAPKQPDAMAGTDTLSAPLTDREREVLQLLIGGRSNKHIGRELNLQEVTVKVHLRNVYRKINATNRTDAVRIAIMQGWSPVSST